MTVDAIIVGSGPGGSTVADVLTAAGWSVVIFEKGRNHLIDLEHPERLVTDYSNDEIKFLYRHFLGPDPFLEPRTFRTGPEQGEHSFVGEVNSIPSTVGGGGTHADGKVPRFREEDFRLLSTFGPQAGAEVADWPLTYADLEPFYAEVERSIGVEGDADANPLAAWRSGPYPMPPGPSMYGAVLSSAAAETLGYHPYPAPGATNSVPYDGRPACNNCGFCAFFGCPIHAKGDPVAMLQRAMMSGNAELRPETFVSRIRTDGRRATGVDFIGPDGVRTLDGRPLCGGGRRGGRDAPAVAVVRLRPPAHRAPPDGPLPDPGCRRVRRPPPPRRAGTGGHPSPRRRAGPRRRLPGGGQGGRAPLDARGHRGARRDRAPHPGSQDLPVGPAHKESMRRSPLRDRMWAFTMQGEDLPVATNRIDLDPSVRDVRGFPVARYTYAPHPHELAASAHHGPRMAAILEAMGAEWTSVVTSPGTAGGPAEKSTPDAPMSRHVMGTVRMGEDPATSVADANGCLHQLPNVVIADSSVFVTSSGYGPTLTLAALAARAATAMIG